MSINIGIVNGVICAYFQMSKDKCVINEMWGSHHNCAARPLWASHDIYINLLQRRIRTSYFAFFSGVFEKTFGNMGSAYFSIYIFPRPQIQNVYKIGSRLFLMTRVFRASNQRNVTCPPNCWLIRDLSTTVRPLSFVSVSAIGPVKIAKVHHVFFRDETRETGEMLRKWAIKNVPIIHRGQCAADN